MGLRQDATMLLGMPAVRTSRRHDGARYGEYEVVAPLAHGGMGGVFLAAHVTTGDRVALKVLDPLFAGHDEVVTRLFAERGVAARARHPGLVDIRSAARNADGTPYLVMEYLDGDTLAAIMARGPVEQGAIVAFAAQAAAALASLHQAGVIHCDIKPENILVVQDRPWGGWPAVKVIDFGVSRLVDEPPPDEAAIAGTPAYMPPEQWHGRPELASDVYALGCVLYELVTGEIPFDGSLPQLMHAHREQRPARPSWLRAGLSAPLERLILRMLAKAPGDRPTMEEVAFELGDLCDFLSAGDTLRIAV